MGGFNIDLDYVNKVLKARVWGSFSPEDGLASIYAYQQIIMTFPANEYNIDINCTQLHVYAPDVLPLLEGCFLMYKADGFKQVIFRIANNPILKMQLMRIAGKANLDNYCIIEVTN